MVNPADTHGKRLAMAVWGKKPNGTDDIAIVTGTASWDGMRLTMVRDAGESLLIEHQWLARLKAVEPELKETFLGAEYYFSLTTSPALAELRRR
jgi:hypothetical protein